MNISGKPLKKLIRSKSGLKIVTANDEDKSPFVQQEPEWIPDCEVRIHSHSSMFFIIPVQFRLAREQLELRWKIGRSRVLSDD